MKNGKNTLKKWIRIGAIILLAINLYACGSSNNVVSNGFIQKRKHTKGWFVKSSKLLGQKKKKEVLAEKPLVRTNVESKNPIEAKLKLKKVSSLHIAQNSPVPDFSLPFVTKKTVRSKKGESIVSVVSENPSPKIVWKRKKHAESNSRVKGKSEKPKRKLKNIDWENAAVFIVGGLLILGLILAIILDSAPLLAIVFLIGGVILLVILIAGVVYIFRGIGSFFDMMFR